MRSRSLSTGAQSLAAWLDTVRAILWRLRTPDNRGASLGLFLTVFLISGSLAGIPRLLTQTTDKGVVAEVGDAIRGQPGISLGLTATLPGNTNDPMAAVAADGDQFRAGMVPVIQHVVSGSSYVVESQRFNLTNPFGSIKNSAFFQTYLTLRYQSGLDRPGLITLISGQLPKPIPPVSPSVFQGKGGNLGDQPLPAFQIALDQATAQALDVKLGDRVILRPDVNDVKTAGIPSAYLNYTLIGQVSGIFKASDATARYWQEDNHLLQPTVSFNGNSTTAFGYGLISPAAYPALLSQTSPVNWSYTWRYDVDPSRVGAGNEQALQQSVRSLLLTHGSAAGFASDPSAVSLQSPLVSALEQFHAQRAFLRSAVTLAALGVVAVAAFLLILVNLLVVERAADGALFLRSRGAAPHQLLHAQAVQAILVALPAAAIGYLAACFIIPTESSGLDIASSFVSALFAIGLATLVTLSGARTPLGRLLNQRRNLGPGAVAGAPLRARRIAIELVVVLLAAAGIYLMRRRGLITSTSGGIDPYLALVPFVAGLGAGILLLRLYPIPVRIVGRIFERGRGIVIWAGLRRVTHQGTTAQLPTLALLVAVGLAVFSLIVQNSLALTQDTAVWQTVGADFRIDASPGSGLPENWNLRAISGVKAVAPAYYQSDISVRNTGGGNTNVNGASLLAIDAGNYQAVTQGTLAAVNLPVEITRQPTGVRVGTQDNPLPAVLSADWPGGAKVGHTLQVILASVPYWIRVTGTISNFPSMPAAEPFIITGLPWLQAANNEIGANLPITRVYVRGRGTDVATKLQQAIERQATGAVLTTRANALANNSRQLLATGVTNAFRFSVVLVTLYAAAAGSVALMLSGAERRRDLSYLRTLGLSSRQALGIIIAEQLPPILSAAGAGAGLGVAIARLMSPALDLSAFTGRAGVVSGIVVSWWQVLILAGGISLLVLAAIIVFGFVTRNVDLADTLRLGGG